MTVYPRNKANEALGLLLVFFTVLIYLSLISYSPIDESFNVSAPLAAYQNFIGRIGAWIADLLLQAFGLAAFLLPLPLVISGYKMVRGRPIDFPYVKLLGFVAILFSLSVGLSLTDLPLPESINFTVGGVIGILLSAQLLTYLNWTGSFLVVGAVFLLSLILTTRFSVGATLNWFSTRKWKSDVRLLERWADWRKARANRKKLKSLRNRKQSVVNQPLPRKVSFQQPQSSEAEESITELPSKSENPILRVPVTPPQSQGEWVEPKESVGLESRTFTFPAIDFLNESGGESEYDEQELVDRAYLLANKCAEFDVNGQVLQIHPGPVVTTFEFKPDPGVKYSRITNLADDLCLALRAESIRIDRVPGKNTVGVEVPNRIRSTIYLRDIVASPEFNRSASKLTLGLGKVINGGTFVADLARMPHLLIAGSTGSGKSVGLNCMVCSILFKATPDEVRFIMVDPKRLELGLYEDIPHLLTPIVTNPKQASNALNWAVREMEERYRLLAQWGVRNIDQFNKMVRDDGPLSQEDAVLEPLPFIVILVDELADLMMTAGKEVETSVTRLAQMARAVGLHLILATQRPSVDVLTGLIKANFPSRISFRVSSKIDSRTILDTNGAERLLGMGDMLYLSPGTSRLVRIHGPLITEKEITRVVNFLKDQAKPEYREEILSDEEEQDTGLVDVADLEDPLFEEAAHFVVEARKASTSLLQRRFRIGYGRAARLLDMMEHEGFVGPPEGSKPREVLVPVGYFSELNESG